VNRGTGQLLGLDSHSSGLFRRINLNIRSSDAINRGVRLFRNIWFALAAFLWLPASAHCQLESLPGLEFFQCVVDEQPACDPSKDCGECGCFAVEKAQYHSAQIRLTLPAPDLQPALFAPRLNLANILPKEDSLGILTAAPPQLLQTWQFVSRTALPVRAPSFAS